MIQDEPLIQDAVPEVVAAVVEDEPDVVDARFDGDVVAAAPGEEEETGEDVGRIRTASMRTEAPRDDEAADAGVVPDVPQSSRRGCACFRKPAVLDSPEVSRVP